MIAVRFCRACGNAQLLRTSEQADTPGDRRAGRQTGRLARSLARWLACLPTSLHPFFAVYLTGSFVPSFCPANPPTKSRPPPLPVAVGNFDRTNSGLMEFYNATTQSSSSPDRLKAARALTYITATINLSSFFERVANFSIGYSFHSSVRMSTLDFILGSFYISFNMHSKQPDLIRYSSPSRENNVRWSFRPRGLQVHCVAKGISLEGVVIVPSK